MSYPFNYEHPVTQTRIFGKNKSENRIFPHYLQNGSAVISGCSKNEWDDVIYTLVIYCKENNLQKIVVFWGDTEFRICIDELDFKTKNITNNYIYGREIQMYKSLNDTLNNFKDISLKIELNRITPPISHDNPSCVKVIFENNLSVFGVFDRSSKLTKTDEHIMIGRALSYASAHSFRGVIFDCVHDIKRDNKIGHKEKMFRNIIIGIQSKSYLHSTFILNMIFGGGSCFDDISDFTHFILELRKHVDVRTCIDVNLIRSSGNEPFNTIKCIRSFIPVDVVILDKRMNPDVAAMITEYCVNYDIALFI